MEKINLTNSIENFTYRATSFIDEQSYFFEKELDAIIHRDKEMIENFAQNRCFYVENISDQYYFLQIKKSKNRPLIQFAITYKKSKHFPFYYGHIKKFNSLNLPFEDIECIFKIIQTFVEKSTPLMSIRIQSFDFSLNRQELLNSTLQKNRFYPIQNLDYTHTRQLKLEGTDEELIALLSSKTRAKVRHKSHENFFIQELKDLKYILPLKMALEHSFKRSADLKINSQLDNIMKMAIKHPDKCKIIGYGKKTDIDSPTAFVIAILGDKICEYFIAGSLDDPELRSVPFNYLLVWSLILWGKKSGAALFDYGGISDEGPNDSTANISYFKRRFPGDDLKVASEFIWIRNHLKWHVFILLKKIQKYSQKLS